MLILTRRQGQALFIGDEVSVTVLGVRGGQVRLGVQAPRDIAIHREEVAQDYGQPAEPDAEEAGQPSAE